MATDGCGLTHKMHYGQAYRIDVSSDHVAAFPDIYDYDLGYCRYLENGRARPGDYTLLGSIHLLSSFT